MREYHQHYVDGRWVAPFGDAICQVANPASGEPAGSVVLADGRDVNRAVAAAVGAQAMLANSSVAERREWLEAIVARYSERIDDVAEAITDEMGAPLEKLSKTAQATAGLAHFSQMLKTLETFDFAVPVTDAQGNTHQVLREPVGVCALITPWNWPLNQIACKVAPALAAGCAMVLKPSEVAPLSAHVFAEIVDAAGLPAGVFNMIDGNGAEAGTALTSHPDVRMISFTGSTRAGKAIGQVAAQAVKGLSLELGGKSANILLDDCNFAEAVPAGVHQMMSNTGQTCTAPSRMLVPRERLAEVEALAADAARSVAVGDPRDADSRVGPLASAAQHEKVRTLIQRGIDEGAKLVAGGAEPPAGLERGYFVQPTVFSDVDNTMTVAREEIFGPVLSILPYDSEQQAIDIANDSDYGLAAYVQSGDLERARRVARQLQAGQVRINSAAGDFSLPFGGYKQSGTGREWGQWGLEEFLEVKAVIG